MHPDFEKNGYLVARSFFDDTTIALMQTYFDFKYRIINYSQENRQAAEKSAMAPVDEHGDVASSFSFYSDHLVESIQLNYGQKASELARMKLSPSYTYTRIYEKGDWLMPHTDRPSCEISTTCPVLIEGDGPSTIYISNYKINSVKEAGKKYTLDQIEERGDYSEINLYPGDVLFYSGCEHFHWRKPLKDNYLIQFFMHYVETDGKFKDHYFDTRPYSGFPENYKA